MKIAVVGTGYVGLTTGAALASLGHEVRGFDTNRERVRELVRGDLPFYEAGLAELVAAQSAAGRLSVSDEIGEATRDADLLFVCVGTPAAEDGRPDVSQVEEALDLIAGDLTPRTVVVLKSTVPIGTGDRAARTLSRRKRGRFPTSNVAVNPEFLREGTALPDFYRPDRVVLGVEGDLAKSRLVRLYGWVKAPLVLTDRRTAEVIKYAANAFLAAKISFVNELARVCVELGVNALDVAQGIGLDRRIGLDFLEPGVGFGGSCLPKDLAALIFGARAAGVEPKLLNAVAEVNQTQPEWLIARMEEALSRAPRGVGGVSTPLSGRGRRVAVWGLSFKPGTDDTRTSPSLALVRSLLARGYEVTAYDPMARLAGDPDGWRRVEDPYAAADGAHALILATAWPEFRSADWRRLRRLMAGNRPAVVDGRNALEPAALVANGFTYVGVGRHAGRG